MMIPGHPGRQPAIPAPRLNEDQTPKAPPSHLEKYTMTNPLSRFPSPALCRIGFLLIPLALPACESETQPHFDTQVIDSAGVTIVESSGFPDLGSGGWSLEQSPSLTVGTFDGDTLYQLYEVSGGTRLSDGRIAISDAGSFQLRVFGTDGDFQAAFGREGEGPGEFKSIRLMGVLPGDTLVVMDGSLRRISLFHPDRGFLSQSTVEEDVGITWVTNGMFGSGSIVFGGGLSFGPGGDMPTDGLNRPDTPYRSANLGGTLEADFGTVPGSEFFMRSQSSGGEYFISASLIPFGRSPAGFARGDRFYLGSADTYLISSFDPGGQLRSIIRVLVPPPPVTSQNIDGLIQRRVDELEDPSGAPGVRSSLREMPTPETMPAYQSLRVDTEGFLWVEDYLLPDDGLRSWTVFDPQGVPITRLSLPRDNRILEIGRDFVLTVYQDQLEVEYLRVYPLIRGRR